MNRRKLFSSHLPLSASALGLALLSAQGCALTSGAVLSPRDQGVRTIPTQPNVSPQTKASQTPLAKPKPGHVGKASWYGPGFSGKKTASGEIFDDGKFTAAHKTLPLGSAAKVTNLSNGKSVNVAINDRGPYAGNRIIDLSRAAARAIGMIDDGVIEVKIDPLAEGGEGTTYVD